MTAPTTDPLLLVAGDSFSGPPNAADVAAGYVPWHALLGAELGLTVDNRAVFGAGYVATGGLGPNARRSFSQQLTVNRPTSPRLVVVMGSQNDAPAYNIELTLSAWQTMRQALEDYPHARHLWVGPVACGTNRSDPAIARARDDVLQAVWRLPFQRWCDPLVEGWFPPSRPELVGPDGKHPSAAGQRHMYERLLPHARAVLGL